MFLKSNSSCLMSNFPADILIIDDERQIRRLLNLTLTGAGYHVRECENGQLGLSETALKRPDAIILDLGLPDINGLEVLKQLREWTQVPILILTAWDREDEKVDALDAGADDYLVKPFSFQELEARIKALLRRSGNESVHMALRCGDLVLDPPSHRAIRNGQVIDLTVKEYRLLEYFIQNQGTALSRMNLLKNVWDKDFDTNTNVVDVYVNYLRTKIDKDFEPKLIRTVVGVGYMMEA